MLNTCQFVVSVPWYNRDMGRSWHGVQDSDIFACLYVCINTNEFVKFSNEKDTTDFFQISF